MGSNWKFSSGDWNVICDVCGRKMKASSSKKRWDGAIVCPEDYETRHIQEFLKVSPDKISVPYIRKVVPSFGTQACTVASKHPYADYAWADCATVGFSLYDSTEITLA